MFTYHARLERKVRAMQFKGDVCPDDFKGIVPAIIHWPDDKTGGLLVHTWNGDMFELPVGSWIVREEGKYSIMSDEQFRREFVVKR